MIRKTAPYAAAYILSLLICLPLASSCAALRRDLKLYPAPSTSGVCGDSAPVILDSSMGPEWDARVKSRVKFWNGILGKRVLWYFGRQDLKKMRADGELDDRSPFITIEAVDLVREVEMYEAAKAESERLGRKVLPSGAVAYLNYWLEGSCKPCVHGTRVYMFDEATLSDNEEEVVQFMLTHELGHALGLALDRHSMESRTLMYRKMYVIENVNRLISSFDLGEDTMAEIRAMYGDPVTNKDLDK